MSKTYKVRAKTLETAMSRAKIQFGPDAMVIDTRHIKVKDPEKMGIDTMVELSVSPGSSTPRRVSNPRLESVSEVFEEDHRDGNYHRKLQQDIQRLEQLIQAVTNAQRKLRMHDDAYPLGEMLRAAGVSSGGLRVLKSSFEEKVPASEINNREEALRHLRDYLGCVSSKGIADVAGVHVFLGSAGCGKTNLVIKLATALVQEHKKVAVVLAAPYHVGEVKRIEAAASAIMIDAAVARDADDLARALQFYADKDAILIDTPCWLSSYGSGIQEIFSELKEQSDVYKHYVCALTNDFSFLLQELELYREWDCDFVALSKIDMVTRMGKAVDLALSRRVTFSLLSEERPEAAGVYVAEPEFLIDMLVPPPSAETNETLLTGATR